MVVVVVTVVVVVVVTGVVVVVIVLEVVVTGVVTSEEDSSCWPQPEKSRQRPRHRETMRTGNFIDYLQPPTGAKSSQSRDTYHSPFCINRLFIHKEDT